MLQTPARLVIISIFDISTASLLQFVIDVPLAHDCLTNITDTVNLTVCGLSCILAVALRHDALLHHPSHGHTRPNARLPHRELVLPGQRLLGQRQAASRLSRANPPQPDPFDKIVRLDASLATAAAVHRPASASL